MAKITYSIIIPVYNVGEYIEECVESILKQKTKYEFEIILVNDGSTDNSIERCEKYLKDIRIKLINQKNSGPSSARNAGIKASKGEYLLFIDGDDFVDDNYLACLDKYVENKADIVVFSYAHLINKERLFNTIKHEFENISGKEYLNNLWTKGENISFFVWSYLFKKNTLEENVFDESLKNGEDFDFIMRVLPHAKNLFSVNIPIYVYRYRRGSITATKSLNKHITDIKIHAKYYCIYKNYALANSCVRAMKDLLCVFSESKIFNYKEVVTVLKVYKKIIFKSKGNFIIKVIYGIFGLNLGTKIYCFIHRIKGKFKKINKD